MSDERMQKFMKDNGIDPGMAWINDVPSAEQVEWYRQQIALASNSLQAIVYSNGLNGNLFEPEKPLWFAEDFGSDGIECAHAVFHQFLFAIDQMRRKAWRAAGNVTFLERTPWVPPLMTTAIES